MLLLFLWPVPEPYSYIVVKSLYKMLLQHYDNLLKPYKFLAISKSFHIWVDEQPAINQHMTGWPHGHGELRLVISLVVLDDMHTAECSLK